MHDCLWQLEERNITPKSVEGRRRAVLMALKHSRGTDNQIMMFHSYSPMLKECLKALLLLRRAHFKSNI